MTENEGRSYANYSELSRPAAGLKKRQNFTSCAEIFYFAGNQDSCFTCFVVFDGSAVHSSSTADAIKWSYPIPPFAVLKDYPNVEKFVFTEPTSIHSSRDFSFTFVLTNSIGIRTYGHGTTFTNNDIVVVLSPYPWCNFFRRLASLYRANGGFGEKIVKLLFNSPTPPSGAPFLVPLDCGTSFMRPYDRLCSFVDTCPFSVLEGFPTSRMLSILADLLLEKHIVVFGPSHSVVSNTIMSLLALIAPFDWMHILIPILPSCFISVLAAPPPYLVGLLNSQAALVEGVVIESAVFIYVDEYGSFLDVVYHNETQDSLPSSGPFSALTVGLRILKWRSPVDYTTRDLCSLLLTYYATLFGNLLMYNVKAHEKEKHEEQTSTLRFYQRLLCTQSFSVLNDEFVKATQADCIEWLDNEFIVATVRAHRHMFPDHYDLLVREEQQGGGYIEKYNECFGSGEDFTSWTAAVHGFGGHGTGVLRLLSHCLCVSGASES